MVFCSCLFVLCVTVFVVVIVALWVLSFALFWCACVWFVCFVGVLFRVCVPLGVLLYVALLAVAVFVVFVKLFVLCF